MYTDPIYAELIYIDILILYITNLYIYIYLSIYIDIYIFIYASNNNIKLHTFIHDVSWNETKYIYASISDTI